MLNTGTTRPATYFMLGLCLGAQIMAGPLDETKVAGDAKWVLHLDCEAFRQSKVGSHLVANFLEPKIEASGFARKANLSINLTNISSVTVYGPDFEKNGEGVLVLSTTADVKKDLDTLVGMSSKRPGGENGVTLLEETPTPIYQLKNDLLVAPLRGGIVVAAKSREQLERAREVVAGKEESISKTDSFKALPKASGGFFFLGMADGLSKTAKIPPQAQLLRETDGGRLVIGESENSVFVNLVFRGKDEASTTRVQQVLQGIVALVAMSQQNEDVTELASSAKISGEGRNVTVNLQFPTTKAIDRVNRHLHLNVEEEEVGVELKFGGDERKVEEASE